MPRKIYPEMLGKVILQVLTDRVGITTQSNLSTHVFEVSPTNPLGFHGGTYQGVTELLGIFFCDHVAQKNWKRFVVQPSPPFAQVNPQWDASASRLDWGAHGYWAVSLLKENPRYGPFLEFEGNLRVLGVGLIVDYIHQLHIASPFYRQNKSWFVANRAEWHYEVLAEFDVSQAQVRDHLFQALRRWNSDGQNFYRWDMYHWLHARDKNGYLSHLFSAPDSPASSSWSIGEVLNGDVNEIRRHLNETDVPSVYNYPFFYCVNEQLTRKDGDLVKVANVFQDLFSDGIHPSRLVNFISNHDQDLLPSVMVQDVWYHRNDRVAMALSLLFYVPGIPSIYYLDWTGEEGLNLTGAARTGRSSLCWEEKGQWPFYRKVGYLLRVYFEPFYAALTHGDYRELWRPGEMFPAPILVFARTLPGAESVVIVINNDDIMHQVRIPIQSLGWKDIGSLQEALELSQDFFVKDGMLVGTCSARTVLALTRR
jgi:hypothetical protein